MPDQNDAPVHKLGEEMLAPGRYQVHMFHDRIGNIAQKLPAPGFAGHQIEED